MPLNVITAFVRAASRRVMTGKRGNKNFYKGRGVRNPGFHTSKGTYKIVPKKIPEFIVPDLTDFPLKPYVSHRSEPMKVKPMTADELLQNTKENLAFIKYKTVP